MWQQYLYQIQQGDVKALARSISLVENEVPGYELLLQSKDNIKLFLIGNVVAFIVAVLAIKFFLGIIKKYGFKPWGYYRIIMGIFLVIYFSYFK